MSSQPIETKPASTTDSKYTFDPIDDVQSHMLGVIAGLMTSYALNPAHVQDRYEYVLSLSKSDVTDSYYEYTSAEVETKEPQPTPLKETMSWADLCDEDYDEKNERSFSEEETQTETCDSEDLNSKDEVSERSKVGNNPIYVTTRREFCNAMSKGIKICPQYSNCAIQTCKNFHIDSKYICSHITRGSYCDDNTCDLIVIRPCRKGKRCNDSKCSFRHS